ncbi:MAG: D-glycero-beta-D-manno-heptose 1-phosphate adenylyltransferase [Chloroflexota bacterium]
MTQLMTLTRAYRLRLRMRDKGQSLVLTNGVFDLLHVGHLDYLEKARALGDALWVAINDDESVARYKGEGRPLVPAAERARLLAALAPVDVVLTFGEDTADNVLRQLHPDVYVKGGDYAHKPLPERPTVESYGGQIALIDYLPNHSTTALIAKVRALPTPPREA